MDQQLIWSKQHREKVRTVEHRDDVMDIVAHARKDAVTTGDINPEVLDGSATADLGTGKRRIGEHHQHSSSRFLTANKCKSTKTLTRLMCGEITPNVGVPFTD